MKIDQVKLYSLTSFLILFYMVGIAQERNLHGIIISEDIDPVPYAQVFTTDGQLLGETDLNGRFDIEVPNSNKQFKIDCIGMEDCIIEVEMDCQNLEIILMYHVLYELLSKRQINKLRKERFENLDLVRKKAFDERIFENITSCYVQEFKKRCCKN